MFFTRYRKNRQRFRFPLHFQRLTRFKGKIFAYGFVDMTAQENFIFNGCSHQSCSQIDVIPHSAEGFTCFTAISTDPQHPLCNAHLQW